MYTYKRIILCLLLVTLVLMAGTGVWASETESVSPGEIAATLSAGDSAEYLDLNDPTSAPAGAVFDGSAVTITAAGCYRVSGSLRGQLIVDADGPTELIFDGVSLRGSACLENASKDTLTVTLAPGSANILLDELTVPDDYAQAVLVSKGLLSIGGDGALTVVSGAGDALECKDGLSITGGTLFIKAADDGADVRGPASVSGGSIRITSTGDGIAAENGRVTYGDISVTGGSLTITSQSRGLDTEEGRVLLTGGSVSITSVDDGIRALDITQTGGSLSITAQGYTPEDKNAEEAIPGDGMDGDTISILSGELTIISAGDGIQALTDLTVAGGTVSITSGGGGGNASSHAGDMFMMGPMGRGGSTTSSTASTVSAKGLKSDGDITVSGGIIDLNTSDDSVHGARLCTIEGGTISICSSDDALHCDDMLLITGGDITITDCFEGLEAFAIEVHGGTLSISAVNDGVNANGPEGWGWGGNSSVTDSVSGYSTTYFWQSDGWMDILVTGNTSNMGDGMDSNGALYITGGHLTVSTPGTYMENGIDGGSVFYISGGEVMAGGASSMQPTPYSATDQCVAVIYTSGTTGGTLVTLSDSEGNELWSYTIANYFNCLIVSHPSMTLGNTYTVTYGTQSTTLDFTTSTSISAGSGGWGGGFGGGRGGRPF